MKDQEQISILEKGSTRIVRKRWNCPTDITVAQYLDQRLPPKEKSRFESHLADCDFCLALVGDLMRGQRKLEPAEVPTTLLRTAIDVVAERVSWSPSWKWLLVPALASIVVISFAVLRSRRTDSSVASVSRPPSMETARPPLATPPSPSRPQEKQYVRGLARSRSAVEPLEPRPGSIVQPQGLKFRWRAVADAAYYEIGVVNAEGDLVWRGEATNTSTQLPESLSLEPGKYFFWVHAYLTTGRTLKSDAVTFQVRKPG